MVNRISQEELIQEKDKLLGRAWGYSQLKMHKEAMEECRKLIRLYPDDPWLFIKIGNFCEESGATEKAIKYYRFAIKKFPNCSWLYINLGYNFEKHRKRIDMATVCYEKALELDPHDVWALNNVATMLKKAGRAQEAVAYYEKSYEVCKRSGMKEGKIMHNLAWAYYHVKNYAKAWEIFCSLADECPDYDNRYIYGDCGCIHYKMGNYRQALQLIEEGLLLYPNSKRYRRLYMVANKKVSL